MRMSLVSLSLALSLTHTHVFFSIETTSTGRLVYDATRQAMRQDVDTISFSIGDQVVASKADIGATSMMLWPLDANMTYKTSDGSSCVCDSIEEGTDFPILYVADGQTPTSASTTTSIFDVDTTVDEYAVTVNAFGASTSMTLWTVPGSKTVLKVRQSAAVTSGGQQSGSGGGSVSTSAIMTMELKSVAALTTATKGDLVPPAGEFVV